ncbi:hypothetical protein N0V93_000117 [Gnomoniopsis smithogilvyi]|uniref:Uncharacterized protein n=1 Tax=Gnomoniopsis smithogilvyi TaxID=1191159 RepID=A0A9W9D1F4_9PEZI|nr:hypothetical protein N0V93_000117 [Gnomoniopsis smithogilvyi]
MKMIAFVLLASMAVASLLPVRLMPAAPLNLSNIANVHLLEGAIEMIQGHDIWIPDVVNLTEVAANLNENFTQLAIYLESIVNMEEEIKKYNASELEVNNLFIITPRTGSTTGTSIKDPPNGYGVDCGHCHLCEEACIATIWFPPFLWLCEGLCQAQSWCYHCD